jgi:dihydrofolate reductase
MISLIVAFDINRGIGHNNHIPWFIPGELKWVAQTTKHTLDPDKRNALIMGHNTWLSLPEKRRPLPDRLNVVISRSAVITHENVVVCRSLDEAVALVEAHASIETGFIFGGASIYEQALKKPCVDEMLLTIVPGDFPSDTFFPPTPEQFLLVHETTTDYENATVIRQTWQSVNFMNSENVL